MKLSIIKIFTSLVICLLVTSFRSVFAFTLVDGLTTKEAINLATMLEASGSFVSNLPVIDSLSSGEEITSNIDIISWTSGEGNLAITLLDDSDTGFVMTGKAYEDQTFTGLATFQNMGVREPSNIEWTGSFNEDGWNSSISGFVDNQYLTMNYEGNLIGNLDEDINVSFNGNGSYDSKPVSILQGEANYFYNSTLEAYTSMDFEQLIQINDNPWWLWVVGAEVLAGGVIGGIAAQDGYAGGSTVGGVFQGAATGLLASAAVVTVRKGFSEETPPTPPTPPEPPSPIGTIPIIPEPVAVPEPLTILGAGSAIAFGAGFKRKLAKAKKK